MPKKPKSRNSIITHKNKDILSKCDEYILCVCFSGAFFLSKSMGLKYNVK